MPHPESPCPVCGANTTEVFFSKAGMPVHSCILWKTEAEATRAPLVTMDLAFCGRCTHVFNPTFQAALLEYDEDYENSLHHSPMFRDYADEEIRHLEAGGSLKGRLAVDVGCGKGDFLARLVELTSCRGIGYDRSYDGKQEGKSVGALEFRKVYFEANRFPERADLICNRQVLEHIEQPIPFLRMIHAGLVRPEGSRVYLEVPDAAHMIESFGFWDILYEHISMFTDASLLYALESAGLRSPRLRRTFHGMFLVIEGIWDGHPEGAAALPDPGVREKLRNQCLAFSRAFDAKVEAIQAQARACREAGKTVVAWGAGARGNTLLNLAGLGSDVRHIVDVNPAKRGFFMGGTGQRILAPSDLAELKPDEIWVVNPVYLEEIRGQAASLGLSAKVIGL